MHRSISFASVCGAFAIATACTTGDAPAFVPPALPPPPPSTSASTVAVVPPPDPFAALRARGDFARDPIALADGAHLVLFGENDGAIAAAWTLDSTGKQAIPLAAFPAAVKLVDAVVVDKTSYVIVESLAALDQPAGMRAVVPIADTTFDPPLSTYDLDVAFAFRDVKDAAALKVAAAAPKPENDVDSKKHLAALVAAAASPKGFRASFSHDGVDVYTSYQGLFLASTEHFDAQSWKEDAHGKALLAGVKKLASEGLSCGDVYCWSTKGGPMGAFLVREGGEYKIRGLLPYRAPAKSPKTLTTSGKSPSADAIAKRHLSNVPRVVGSTTFASGGTFALARSEDEHGGGTSYLLFSRGPLERVVPAYALDQYGGADAAPKFDLRFLDADRDGDADLLVRNLDTGLTELYRAPRSIEETYASSLSFGSLELAINRAPTLDAAAQAIDAYVSAEVKDAEACALINKATNLKGFLAASTDDAVVMMFEEPGYPMLKSKVTERAKLTADDVQYLGSSCKNLECEGSRCDDFGDEPGPGSTHYWFTRTKKGLRLAGVAWYGGS